MNRTAPLNANYRGWYRDRSVTATPRLEAFFGTTRIFGSTATLTTFDLPFAITTTKTLSGEEHGFAVSYTGTASSGDSMVGGNFICTTAGTAAAWASGIFAKVVQGSTKNVNGYLCAAEFELISACANMSDSAVLVLNSVVTGSGAVCHPYIMCREYGSAGTYGDVLVRFYNDTGQSGTTDGATLVSTTAGGFEANCDYTIRCMVGTTPLWILCSSTTPEA